MNPDLVIIGGGLAGSEAAWQAAERGVRVLLYEMRPRCMTEAHSTGDLAEIVCSNSFKSNNIYNAHGLLKEELRMLGSLIIQIADKTGVPAGSALAVDRKEFSRMVTEIISSHPKIKIIREEVFEPSFEVPVIIATGPLTSDRLTKGLQRIIRHDLIYFYDAISPIISGDSVNGEIAFRASRYNKGGADYINCPLSKEEYEQFYNMLITADRTPVKDFENIPYFEGCMPVEVLAGRGIDTPLFGPLKPVGLKDPRSGEQPYAVVQLRQEDKYGQAYNMVGFQTRLKCPEQRRVFRKIPGLEQAEFLRYGSLHRNTFINSPLLLDTSLRLKQHNPPVPHFNPPFSPFSNPPSPPLTKGGKGGLRGDLEELSNNIYMAGQIIGVEGYSESTAMGLLAGLSATMHIRGKEFIPPHPATCIGSLLNYVITGGPSGFQPMNINWGLLPPLSVKSRDKEVCRKKLGERAIKDIERWKVQSKAF